MYTKNMLGIEQCQAAITAMIAEFNKDPSRQPITMAIVDDRGELVSYARLDKCRPGSAKNAIKKAYTSAVRGMETGAYSEELKSQGRSVSDMGDPMLLPLQGGIPVVDPSDGTVLGGIGVGGLPAGKADEDISRVGLKALGF